MKLTLTSSDCCSLSEGNIDFSFSYVSWVLANIMTVSSFRFCVGSGNVTETQDAEFCIIVLLEIRGRLSCS